MQRTKLLRIPYVELLVVGFVILLLLVISPDLISWGQVVRAFVFLYGLIELAKLNNGVDQRPRADELDNELLDKYVTIGSTAVEEVKDEMKKIGESPLI